MMLAIVIRLLTGVQARWVGTTPPDPDAPVAARVYFANHGSNLDGPVIWASLPKHLRRVTRPVAAADFWDKGLVRRYLATRCFNSVLVERHHVTRANNPLEKMERAIHDGQSLIIFPAGTRSEADDENIGEFKGGLWHLARKNPQTCFVPVYLENLNRILPKGEIILIPLLAAVRFGPPMRIAEDESKVDFLARANCAIRQLKEEEC